MSIWCSYPTIGWDDEGADVGGMVIDADGVRDPEPHWSGGEVRSYAVGWSNHYPDGTAEYPASIDLADIAPWCVPGWWDRSDELDREVGPWLRMGVHSPHAVTYWSKDAEGNPTPNPEVATVVLDVAAVQALYDQLGRWLAAEKITPIEETD